MQCYSRCCFEGGCLKHYKAVVVGGGIVGAGIFRDLSLNGVPSLLVDARDFSSQTSERSSKMLHGGIRYLENFDFELVFEALHEKNLWLKITPHLAREEAFYLPVYDNAKRPLWMIRMGLFIYDFLSKFKNSPFSIKSKEECLKAIPILNQQGLSGAGVYYDGVMDDAKLTLEVIYDALLNEKKAEARNYTEVVDVKKLKKRTQLTLKDTLNGTTEEITCDQIVYALGPFTDRFLKRFPFYHWKDVLLPSKGSHIWISARDLPLTHPIVMTPSDEKGDRVIFVIPHGDKILVGTTEVQFNGDFFDVRPDQDEINYLIKNLNQYFPHLKLSEKNIIGSFAGIRPLVRSDEGSDLGKTSREHKIYQPDANTFVIAGGKYTTFRVMGQKISQRICHRFGKSFNPDKSESSLLQRSVIIPFEWHLPTAAELEKVCLTELPRTFEDLVVRRLGIATRAIWKNKIDVDFDQYFLSHLELLSKHIQISKEDIHRFP